MSARVTISEEARDAAKAEALHQCRTLSKFVETAVIRYTNFCGRRRRGRMDTFTIDLDYDELIALDNALYAYKGEGAYDIKDQVEEMIRDAEENTGAEV